MNKIYILLPVHNRKEITQHFINCLKSQTYTNYHLILIDDGSTDGTEEMVRSEIQSLTVLKGDGTWWWAGSLQQGYQYLKLKLIDFRDIVLIINDDTQFKPDFLEQAIKILACHDKTLLLAQCYSLQTNKLVDAGVHVNWKKLQFTPVSHPKNINCLSTRGLFFRIEDFFQIGGFYPRILPHYASDYEFTIRAYRKGYHLTSEPILKIWLDEKTTGYHQIDQDGNYEAYQDFKQIFSIKSSENPFFSSVFIVLACPLQWKILSLCKIWLRFSRQYYNYLRNSS
jgi:GT2 family glycosyltransferase